MTDVPGHWPNRGVNRKGNIFERARKVGKKRPSWLKLWVERECGFAVMDTWLSDGMIHVVSFGKIETVNFTVMFDR